MASFEKRGSSVRAVVKLSGQRLTKTFPNKGEARAWATKQEADILAGKLGGLPDKTFGQLLERYYSSLDAERRRADIIRLKRIIRDDKIAKVHVRDLNSTHAATWRDERSKQVSAASVRREWNLLSPACNVAIKEWKWLTSNPFAEIKRPPKPDARDRRVTEDEIEQVKHASGYDDYPNLDTMTSRVGAAFLFAIETGMRIGEICHIKKRDVYLDKHFVELTGTEVGARKTRGSMRDVALSNEAERIVKQLYDQCKMDEYLFRISSTQVADTLWRKKIVAKTTIKNLHFHDSRHEAITRLARKLDILDLARMVGVVDLKTLMVYYNATAHEIANRLNGSELKEAA